MNVFLNLSIRQLLDVLSLTYTYMSWHSQIVIFSETHKATLRMQSTFAMQHQLCSFIQASRNAVYFRLFLPECKSGRAGFRHTFVEIFPADFGPGCKTIL